MGGIRVKMSMKMENDNWRADGIRYQREKERVGESWRGKREIGLKLTNQHTESFPSDPAVSSSL